MEKFSLSEDSPVRNAQIEIIRQGMAALHPEEPSLSDMDFDLLSQGLFGSLSIKAQYWAEKYYKEGMQIKKKQASDMEKMYRRPATIGEVMHITHDLVNGENGIKQGLEAWVASVNRHLALIGEALRLKGLLTDEDIEAAAKSLTEKAEAEKNTSSEVPPEQPVEATVA